MQGSASSPPNRALAIRYHSLRRTGSTTPALSLLIPPQAVRTEQAPASVVIGLHRPLARDGIPHQLVNVLNRLDLRLDNAHPVY
jgi:hypothetical protein